MFVTGTVNRCARVCPRVLLTGVLSLLTAAALAERLPQMMTPEPAGIDAGVEFVADCDERSALAGIAGTAGDLVQSLAPICVRLDPITGSWAGTPSEGARVGSGGGSAYQILCRPGDVMVGVGGTEAGELAPAHGDVYVRRGGPISGLWPFCAHPRITSSEYIGAPHWRESGDDYYQGGEGRLRVGSGRGLALVRLCPGEYFLRGLKGKTADGVNQIGIDCQRFDRYHLPPYTFAIVASPPVDSEGRIAYFPVPPIKLAWWIRSGAPTTLAPTTRFAYEVLEVSRPMSRAVNFQGGPPVDYPSPTQVANSPCTPENIGFGRQLSIDSRGRNYCFGDSRVFILNSLPNGQYVLLLEAQGYAGDGRTPVVDAIGATQFAFEVLGATGAPIVSPPSPDVVKAPAPVALPPTMPAPVQQSPTIIRSAPVVAPVPVSKDASGKTREKL